MDDVRGALAANLAELRKEENLTQAEFAAQVGVGLAHPVGVELREFVAGVGADRGGDVVGLSGSVGVVVGDGRGGVGHRFGPGA